MDAISHSNSTKEKPSNGNVDSSPVIFIIIAFVVVGFFIFIFRDKLFKKKNILKKSEPQTEKPIERLTEDPKPLPEPTQEQEPTQPDTLKKFANLN